MKRNIKLLTVFNFFTDFVFFAPVAIIYFAKITGSLALGMSIFSTAYITSALLEIPTGVLSDFLGRKKTIIMGSFFAMLCIIFYALASDYWLMFIGALLQGISRSFYSGNNDAFLHDTLRELGKEKEYHTYLGKTSSMFQVALAAASLIGGFLAQISLPLVMWMSVIPQLGCFLLSFFFKEPKVESQESGNVYSHLKEALVQFKSNYPLRLLTITSSLRFAISESSYFLESAFVNLLWPLWGVGVYGTLQHIFGALGFFLSGKLINRFGALKILLAENIINRILSFLAFIFPTPASPVLIASASFPWGAATVSQGSLLQKEFTQKQRATMGSLNSFIGSLAFGFFSVFFGFLGDRIGIRSSLLIATIILIFPLYIYRKIFVFNQVNKKED